MNRKLLFGLVALAALVAGVIGYRAYNAKTPTAAERASDVTIEASALFKAFMDDEMGAGKLYNDKVVEVSGTVREVSADGSGPVNVYLETGDPMGAVACEFEAAKAPEWSAGMKVKLKGFCAGFNLDVLLQRCAAVE